MRAARLVVLGVAVAAGGVAAFLAGHNRQPEPPKPAAVAAPPLKTAEVLVAKGDLARGHIIAAQDIVWQTWPESSANPKFIKKSARPDAITQFVGAIVRVPVAAGQPIYDPMVVFAKGSGFLAAVLPKGMRAVAMEVAPVSDAGGFILPGDHVDILLTHTEISPQQGTAPKIVTNTILENVTVLAVDQTIEQKKDEKAAVARTATLEVTPQQAEILAMARQQGSLSLSLRSLIDSKSSMPETVARRATQTSINTVRYGVSVMTIR